MRDGGLDAGVVGDVERYHVRGAAVGFDLGAQLLQALGAARRQHHLRPGLRQRLREARAQTAGSAGNQRDLSFKIDFDPHKILPMCAFSQSELCRHVIMHPAISAQCLVFCRKIHDN